MDAYCKIAFFVQQIVVVVGLVHLYTEYRCQLPSVYYLMLGVIVQNMKINFDTRYTWH